MYRGHRRKLFLTGVITALTLFGLAPVGASSANLSHAYHTDTAIKNGSIVSLNPAKQDYVVPANLDNGSKLLGVSVATNDSLIAVDAAPGAVQVATTGSATALVSTLNGDIHVGDLVGVSPFNGVGIKALPGSRVIGLAQSSFSAKSPGAISQVVTDKQGKKSTIKVGYVQVNIAVGTNATILTANNLNSLQKFAKTITGRTVSTDRVILSLAVAIVALFALVTLIYASIYGSIVSIGRNPLAKYAVFRTLGSVMGLALLTAVVSGVTIYFLLK
jgi:hypothetical protein